MAGEKENAKYQGHSSWNYSMRGCSGEFLALVPGEGIGQVDRRIIDFIRASVLDFAEGDDVKCRPLVFVADRNWRHCVELRGKQSMRGPRIYQKLFYAEFWLSFPGRFTFDLPR